jgi:hypothetical protein
MQLLLQRRRLGFQQGRTVDATDTELYDQLVGYLTAEGALSEDTGHGLLILTAYDHRPLPTALRLHVTPASLGQHLRAAAPGATYSFPDVQPIEAAWRLFLVHLDEAVRTAKPGETELVLDRTGVLSRSR